ncbi:MAG: glycosyl hydrolase [Myxococcaceae bacterium]|nr:glycosyl hydrolase [Myxococcaceae bacterium]
MSQPIATLVRSAAIVLALAPSCLKPAQARSPSSVTVDCKAAGTPISPLIYGVGLDFGRFEDTSFISLGATARRWGGNTTSRYNWKHGNAWNTAHDWFFRNVGLERINGPVHERFLATNREHGLASALTLPLIGWVAKDTQSVGFPASKFKDQKSTDPWVPEAGNGLDMNGRPVTPLPPTQTSISASPEFIAEWVKSLRREDAPRGVRTYILDNEPMIWHETHRDVHPGRLSYDELLERTVKYGTAVRQADPEAQIAGPAEWGWINLQYSAVDLAAGKILRPDRRAHGDVPLLPWYLRKLREHEKKTGVKVLDVVDVHFYPQAEGLGLGEGGNTDPAAAALRLRSTRALWDPTYKDESYIGEPVRLLPLLNEWIAAEYPGLGVSIGEYNFGAEKHPSGGLAVAEALGRFGQFGVYSAYYWTHPAKDSWAFWAFRAFRNYDGEGARFQDRSIPVKGAAPASVFASRSEDGTKLVLVALNLDPKKAAVTRLDLSSCGKAGTRRTFQYTGNAAGFAEVKGEGEAVLLPPYSMTVIEVSYPAPVTDR